MAQGKHTRRSPASQVPLDREGYLRSLGDWDEEVAVFLAAESGLSLAEPHWEIIRVVRNFYGEHKLSPPMRVLVRLVGRELGEEKGRSIYLMKLFGGSAAKTVSRIAGLPRPSNCI